MFSLLRTELSRFRITLTAKAALLVIAIIPALYGGLYLAANWNPTGNLEHLTAAVVDEDQPATATGPDGGESTISAGSDLADSLTSSDDAGFTWVEVGPEEAQEGLDDGTFAAILDIPAEFSSTLASVGGDAPARAMLDITTDDAESYIVGQVGNTVAATLQRQVQSGATEDYLDSIYLGFSSLHGKLAEAGEGAGKIADGAQGADEGSASLVVGLGSLVDGSAQLTTGSAQVAGGAADLATGAADLATGLDSLDTATADLVPQSQQLADGAASAATGGATLRDGAGELATGTQTVADGAAQLADSSATLAHGTRGVADGVTQVGNGARSLSAGATQLQDVAGQAAAGTRTVAGGLAGLAANYASLTDAERLATLQQLAAGADSAATGSEQIAAGAGTLAASASDLAAGAGTAAGGASDAADGADRLAGGASDLSQGAGGAAAGAAQVSQGAAGLADGLTQLQSGTATLADGTPALRNGIVSASDGASQLAAGASTLSSGAGQVAGGAAGLADGSSQAYDGATQLEDGLGTLSTGSSDLAQQLDQGAGQVPDYDAAQRAELSGVAASPVTIDRTHANAVDAYGEGMAPYFIPLALWVGGIITYTVLRAVSPRALASTAASWRVSAAGYLQGALFAVLQALVLLGILLAGVGLTTPHPLGLLAFTVLTALVFTAIHQALVALLGGVGRLVALVLLMLQLTSAGGTYPVATSPGFFQFMSPLLPMTHAVEGLRHLIAGGDLGVVWLAALQLLVFFVLAAGLSVFASHRRRSWTMEKLHPSLAI
ncbi:YhgE/Pip family protein [Arthrobacter agilis]|uniref:YhgE/Pip family protein n=1 Tax=Arthrobacter agilis TaxID=37921 RepID=UPI0027866383|nr:YhgE/Pip domain-containing protein [Arthrobacter agilis]MDQ0733667.1 putative membrane protein [Arthrobacter agilis]